MPQFEVGKKVTEAGVILGGLGVIGFLGIIWLMIYGNLSGNLGFTDQTDSFINKSSTLTTSGTTFPEGTTRPNAVLVNTTVIVINGTGGELITNGNYTLVDLTLVGTNDNGYNGTVINVTYQITSNSDAKANTESVINNVSGGFGTFFGFSNTFFTIAAIILLIFMLLGLLALAMFIAKMQGGKNEGFS